MKLKSARVTNFRSVEDSGEFTLDQVLCLVGKNEAGKTAIVHALAALNPHASTPITLDKERDYPRRFLTEYATRHEGKEAVVIETNWTLSNAEKEAIEKVAGENVFTEDKITISRSYGDTEPDWTLPIDYKQVVEYLIQEERLSETEIEPLASAVNSQTLIAALKAIASPSARQTSLLARISAFPSQTITGAVKAVTNRAAFSFRQTLSLYKHHHRHME